jgi:MFS family permease
MINIKSNNAQYGIITANYWAFTLTDGALRMLIVLYFYQLGYSALSIAFLFLFYEFFGVVTNLVGGWLGAKIGLNKTMNLGLLLQFIALSALLIPESWLSVPWVMAAQALSGVAKDLNKMSAKAGIKTLVPAAKSERLFYWVALLTGSKNTLKGVGFFLGGTLLWAIGFWWSIFVLAALILVTGLCSLLFLLNDLGRTKNKPKFSQVFSNSRAINLLSLARMFLFASRDVWFVVALPVFISAQYQWSHAQVGSFFAAWIIVYGFIQSLTPLITKSLGSTTNGTTAFKVAVPLTLTTLVLAIIIQTSDISALTLTALLFLFGFFFAINSAVHSYLIVYWSREEGASLDVGFYYMSNALGRLIGTLLSGALFVSFGLNATIIASALMLCCVLVISARLRSI